MIVGVVGVLKFTVVETVGTTQPFESVTTKVLVLVEVTAKVFDVVADAPFHEYIYGEVPPVAVAVKVTVLPTQAIPEEATAAVGREAG